MSLLISSFHNKLLLLLVVGNVCVIDYSLLAQNVEPTTALFYYSYPSSINLAYGNVEAAVDTFKKYEYIVLADTLAYDTHPDHQKTDSIIGQLHDTSSSKVFGYVAATKPTILIKAEIDMWVKLEAKGIFVDVFGFEFGVNRSKQNEIVNYIHGKRLPVMVNAWNVTDALGNNFNALMNPTQIPSALLSDDIYCSESFTVQAWEYQDFAFWKAKADSLQYFQLSEVLGIQVLAIASGQENTAGVCPLGCKHDDVNKLNFGWYASAIMGYKSFAWGECNYSATCSLAPYRARPSIDLGNYFITKVMMDSDEVYRYTDIGRIFVNGVTHTFGMEQAQTCTSLNSGNWLEANRWSCGHVPDPCDRVVIGLSHRIILPVDTQVFGLRLEGQLDFLNNAKLTLLEQ